MTTRSRILVSTQLTCCSVDHESGCRLRVTAAGRVRGERVAFGDDAAVAGGLVVWDESGPCFCADAVADPLTGLAAAVGVLDALKQRHSVLLDIAMARVAAGFAGPTLDVPDGTCAAKRAPLPADAAPGSRFGQRVNSRRDCLTTVTDVLLRDVELDGAITDVHVSDGASAIGEGAPATAESVIDAGGGALIPGLNDHHIHLLATAAAAQSVPLGSPSVRSEAEFELALRNAARAVPTGSWIRAVGYHESVAGDLDATRIDRVVRDRLVRIQHRSGAMWMLNGAAMTRRA